MTRARGYKTFFVLNSVEHEISNAHKYKNIKKFSFCQAQISGECYFSMSVKLAASCQLPFTHSIGNWQMAANFTL